LPMLIFIGESQRKISKMLHITSEISQPV